MGYPAGFDPWVEKIPWRKAWQPTLVVFPGESPWTEEPGRLQSMGSQRAEHDRATKHSTHGIYTWFPSVSTNSQVAQLVHSVCQCRRCKRCWYDPGRSPGEGNGNPLQYSCLENSIGRGAWQATVLGVAKSQTRPND